MGSHAFPPLPTGLRGRQSRQKRRKNGPRGRGEREKERGKTWARERCVLRCVAPAQLSLSRPGATFPICLAAVADSIELSRCVPAAAPHRRLFFFVSLSPRAFHLLLIIGEAPFFPTPSPRALHFLTLLSSSSSNTARSVPF
ncbi:unnamed protein product [Caenorhabditis auriculariae]|uniref:Uncharacterized protein n=1 Tax=Caenorhabditis auriculariae TaxID=2777116 RepID=A0A8S1H3C9_9PELO|nr:unnamed protein product [Caenorhabditis auriculariae]